MPERAKIITNMYGIQKDNKNAYILFETKAAQQKALELNQSLFLEKHIRVDSIRPVEEKDQKVKPHEDYKTTVFVGNLPFVVSEEEVRAHFAQFGTILNVRLIREPKTFIGKGIGYVMFKSNEEMRTAIEKGQKFKGRELRLKKATDPKKREKKANRKADALEERRAKRKAAAQDSDSDEEMLPQKLDAYSSEDSDDEKVKIPKVVDLSTESKILKMGKPEENKELKIQNIIAFNQRKK